MVCLAPRAPGDSVRPRRPAGASVRPLNFTVRLVMKRSLTNVLPLRLVKGAGGLIAGLLCGLIYGWSRASACLLRGTGVVCGLSSGPHAGWVWPLVVIAAVCCLLAQWARDAGPFPSGIHALRV